MPSTQLMVVSGGIGLVSGTITSGQLWPIGCLTIRNDIYSPSGQAVYVGLPNLSGTVNTITSGGSLSSGGMADSWPVYPGEVLIVPKSRMVSGMLTPRLLGAAAASGARVWWDYDIRMDK